MDKETTSDGKLTFFPDQLESLFKLARILSDSKHAVLLALIRYLEPGTLKTKATQNQMKEITRLGYRTISRCIKSFKDSGLLKQWRGGYELKQCYHYFHLPVADTVFEFYRKEQNRKGRSGANSKTSGRQRTVESTVSSTVPDPEHPVVATKPIISDAGAGSGEQDVATSKDEDSREDNGKLKSHQRSMEEESLDPKISSLVDQLEEARVRNTTVEYLISQGVIPFQIASDQELKIDKDELFRFLRRWNANSFMEFTKLVDEFSRTPPEDRPPRIDLALSERLEMWMYRTLDYSYSSGMFWVWGHIKKCDSEGFLLFEEEIRQDFINFMRKYKLRTLDDVISTAIKKDAEIEERRRADREKAEVTLNFSDHEQRTQPLNALHSEEDFQAQQEDIAAGTQNIVPIPATDECLLTAQNGTRTLEDVFAAVGEDDGKIMEEDKQKKAERKTEERVRRRQLISDKQLDLLARTDTRAWMRAICAGSPDEKEDDEGDEDEYSPVSALPRYGTYDDAET